MISNKLALDIINTALKTGGDFAEIYIENIDSTTFRIENTKVDSLVSPKRIGCGIRILKDLQSVYGYTNDLSKKSLLKLADDLSKRFNGEQKIKLSNFKPLKHAKQISHMEIPFDQVDKKEIIEFLKDGEKQMRDYSSDIVRTSASLFYEYSLITIFNSNGLHIDDHRNIARISASCVASKDNKVQPQFVAKGTKAGWEFFKNEINFNEMCHKNAELCITMLNAKECPSGKMPVVIGNGWGGVLFHESCGHPLEASGVSKGLSCFAGKLYQPIASPIVNAYDDATIPNAWGSSNMDDEGHTPHKTQLIKNGICVDYLTDSFNGRRMKKHENGASRRQDFKYEPTSRMSNTYIDNGTSTKDEIIKATKLGLYCVSFNGGSVDPSTGEFNFGASEAYIIRDGKICEPVRGATLIGKGDEILFNIDMIANDLDLADGMCGAASGSIPVQVGQPTLRIKEITVGGAGGKIK